MDQPRRFYLLTSPRTGSNLLLKILALEDQPDVYFRKNGGYFFMPLVSLRAELRCSNKHVEKLSTEQKEKLEDCTKSCLIELYRHIETAESKGKLVVIKEHTNFLTNPVVKTQFLYGDDQPARAMSSMRGDRSIHNETILSDEFLKTWCPAFLIRHPALSFPSFYRASIRADGEGFTKSIPGRRGLQMVMTMRWTRKLYDFYAEHFNKFKSQSEPADWPIVLDADDVMSEPAVLVKFCNIIGLDSNKLRYHWEPAKETKNPPRLPWFQAFRTTLDSSTTILTTKIAADINIDEEAKEWKKEFGEEDGQLVESYVRAAMPDYKFLKSKRLRA
ncbi:hypothetical protein PABG_07527 [Paracoccidioides brasiliensis Pb03]|nr:hypothetical protein PABG_07527 [Paracoccidioides brasiliensis Pb03]